MAANHGFSQPTMIYFDDLDPFGVMHNANYLKHLDRAWTDHWAPQGYRFDLRGNGSPDTVTLVRRFDITWDRPIAGLGEVLVNIWADKVGETSVTLGFRFLSRDGEVEYARGTRVLVKIDPATQRPTSWTPKARADLESILAQELAGR